jgi:hypothetical protein
MSAYLNAIKVYRNRDSVGTWLSLFVFSAGIWLPTVVGIVANEQRPWLGQYLAANLMLLLGLALGISLRKVRAWSASMLVPGMLRTVTISGLLLVTGTWFIYSIVMMLGQGFAGYPVTLSLALGVAAFFGASGVYRRFSFVLLLALILVGVPWLYREITLFLQSSLAEPVLIGAMICLILAMMRELGNPISDQETVADERLVQDAIEARMPVPRISTWMRVSRVTKDRAIAVALEHMPRQAWLNDLATFVAIVALVLLMSILAGKARDDTYIVVAFMVAVAAVGIPLVRRSILSASIDLLWLAGEGETRHSLIHRGFLQLLYPAFRLSLIGIVVAFLLHGASTVSELSIALLLVSIGCSAVVLATALLFGERLGQQSQGVVILFGLVLLGELYAAGWFAVRLANSFEFPLSAFAAAAFSAIAVFVSANVASKVCAGKREWTF